MKMILKSLKIEEMENKGCDNGNYPSFTTMGVNGKMYSGKVCRCQNGCSNTTKIYREGGKSYIYTEDL